MTRGLWLFWRYGIAYELMPLLDYGHTVFPVEFFKNVEVATGPAGLAWGSVAEAALVNVNLRDDLDGAEVRLGAGNFMRKTVSAMYGTKFSGGRPGDGVFVGYYVTTRNPQTTPNAWDDPNETFALNGKPPSSAFVAKVKYKDIKFIVATENATSISPTSTYYGGKPFFDELRSRIGGEPKERLDFFSARTEYTIPFRSENFNVYLYANFANKTWWMDGVAADTQRRIDIGFNGTWKTLGSKLDLAFGGDFYSNATLYSPSYTSYWVRDGYGINWFDSNLTPASVVDHNLFVQGKYAITDQLKILAGTRLEYQAGARTELLLTGPRLGVMYSPSKNLTVKYLFNRGTRRPNLNERFSPVTEENIVAHEVVAVYQSDKVQFQATGYWQRLSNAILPDPTGSGFAFFNSGGVQSVGTEIGVKVRPIPQLLLYTNGNYTDARALNPNAPASAPHNSENRVLFVPRVSATVGAEAVLLELLSVHMDVRGVVDTPYLRADGSEATASTLFVDMTARSRSFLKERFQVQFQALNLFDRQARMPAFGEYAQGKNGTLGTYGRTFFINLVTHI